MRRLNPLPPAPEPPPDLGSKVRAFAREVARRHRGRPVDVPRMVAALRGYHRALSIVQPVPELEARLVEAAVAEYLAARGLRREAAA
jgi:hypothetical protein